MYQEVILDHYKNPTHAGLKAPFDAEVHHVNPSCGDELTLRVKLSDDKQTVVDVSYDATGCSIPSVRVRDGGGNRRQAPAGSAGQAGGI